MDFESVTRGLAEERYDERREHAISAIQLIIQPYFDKLAKEIKGSPQPWYVMKAGEHDPRATLPSDLDVSIRESIEKYEEVEYDQEKQTKYYEIIRWTVNHLASLYKETR
jgi:hypothetical protein